MIVMQKHRDALVTVWSVALMLGAAGIGAVVMRAEAQRSAAKKMMSIGGEKLCVTEGTIGKGDRKSVV